MRVPTRAGVLASGAASAGASFVAKNQWSASTSQVVSFSGAAAGNLAIIIVGAFGTTVSAPSGWTHVGTITWFSSSYFTVIYSKVLTAGDISAGSVTLNGVGSGSVVMVAFYSGATVATLVSSVEGTTSITIPGFTKALTCKGIVTHILDRGVPSTPTAPGTTVNRIPTFNGTFYSARLDDIINPSNYTNGSGLTYTTVSATGAAAAALELT